LCFSPVSAISMKSGSRPSHGSWARSLRTIVLSVAGTEAVLGIDAENARASRWHTDVTFVPAFPLFSVLRGMVIPPKLGRIGASVRDAAGSRNAAGKHGALALLRGRCGDLGQSRDAAQGDRRLRR
jgi:alpha-ketoglutarate-dependent taurine dioxygenase